MKYNHMPVVEGFDHLHFFQPMASQIEIMADLLYCNWLKGFVRLCFTATGKTLPDSTLVMKWPNIDECVTEMELSYLL